MVHSDLKLGTKEYTLSNGLNGAKRLNVLNDLNGIHSRSESPPTEVRLSRADDNVRLFYEFYAETRVGNGCVWW